MYLVTLLGHCCVGSRGRNGTSRIVDIATATSATGALSGVKYVGLKRGMRILCHMKVQKVLGRGASCFVWSSLESDQRCTSNFSLDTVHTM